MYNPDVNFSVLEGKTVKAIEGNLDDYVRFVMTDGSEYDMFHSQDCCERVSIDDVAGGKLEDLVGQKVLETYESSDDEGPSNECDESYTWTFYIIRTNRDSLTIRWYGASNGYYSERVDFKETRPAYKVVKIDDQEVIFEHG